MFNILNLFNRIKFINKKLLKDEEGAGVIELVLIIVVLIGLVIIFKDRIGTLLESIFTNINKSASDLYN